MGFWSAWAGRLQLNVFEPVIALSIFESTEMLKNGIETLKYRYMAEITAPDFHRSYTRIPAPFG